MYNWKRILVVLIIILAIASRLAFLDMRPLHHDEGVNYFFANNIIEGRGYYYNPLNYHGPFYFFALAFSFLIFGISEFSLRFPAAIAGIILTALPLFLLKGKEKYFASLFLLFSPSIMYYSRYSIHEISFVLFSLVGVYVLSLILEKRNLRYLPIFAFVLALLFTIKETAIIMLFMFFVLTLTNYKKINGIELKKNYMIILLSILVFILTYIVFFSSFFAYWRGVFDSFRGFLPWINRGVSEVGHNKLFYYYGLLILKYELPLFILGIVGFVFAWRKGIFWRNIAIWFFGMFVIYSLIPYKTPWLVINLTIPMSFIAGIGALELWKRFDKRIIFVLFVFSLIYLGYFVYFTNFAKPWQEENKLAYVHTDEDVLNLIEYINGIDGKILIIDKESAYWPIPFYLRDRKAEYLASKERVLQEDYEKYFGTYGIVIVDSRLFDENSAEEYLIQRFKHRQGIEMIVVRKV